jgi:hypothetical protein
MNHELDPQLDLADQVHLLLREQPDGSTEYQLLQNLKARHSSHIPNLPLTDRLVLFRSHFLLFNALYILRQRLHQQRAGHVQINPLNIQLLPYAAAAEALVEQDPLREYYLDLRHLRDTDEREVDRLLASFWTRMQGGEDKRAALELFELMDEGRALTLALIKLRYRQLVSQHHPDRGGSTERLKSINLAMEILQRYYR